jgi:hypothetical protein
MLEYRYAGISLCWNIVMLEYRYAGISLCWNIVMLEYHYAGISLCWNIIMLCDYAEYRYAVIMISVPLTPP